jgi:surfactin synthase thioesterase subunit/glycosyltransferase involved in cell wall biosynthesis
MRILLAANASYVPPRGGATRSNLAWLDMLAARGHQCRVVAAALPHDSPERAAQLRDEGLEGQVELRSGAELAHRGAIAIYSAPGASARTELLRAQVREFRPDWVLVSSEDIGQVLLRAAHHEAPGRVVYLAHTPQFFPFGPESWNPDPHGAALVARSAAVVAIGRHMAAYVERHCGRPAEVIHPPIYGGGPFPDYGRLGQGLVTMINPCAVKGISIFLPLAARFPETGFAALRGWGTTAQDREALAALANVRLLPNCRDIDELLRQTRILLMPSLWYEGFGLIVIEAMLRGIPVIASDSGGLKEAKRGTGFVVPVRPIERYEPVFDERGMPRPVLPPQDIEPWAEALRALLSGRRSYDQESAASRRAATEFIGSLRPERLEEFLGQLQPEPKMRILLAQNSPYYPAHGGGDRSNRLLLEALAARGHACRVVARLGSFGEREHEEYLRDLAGRGVPALSTEDGVVAFPLNGVEAHVVTSHPHLRAYFASQIEEFQPSVILASTDDPAQVLLEAALRSGTPVVYLVRATLAVPFGPDCAFPSEPRTGLLRQARAVVGVSRYVADYVRTWAGIPAVHVPISLMEPGPYPEVGRFENEFVTIANPCAVKGISIFLELADAMPEIAFAAVPTWGTTGSDLAALRARPNVRILDPVDNIDDLLRRTRVLLVPSLWAEARSRIVLEAMLRGVPVIASDVGGISEAKMGVPYLLPVRPIARYQQTLDAQMVPVADVPPQDLAPWREALARLLSDREHWEHISLASREAALAYAAALSVEPFEEILRDAAGAPAPRAALDAKPAEAPPRSALERLSPEKRRLLALRLQKKVAGHAWFPGADRRAPGTLRLFVFPHAGAGASVTRGWADHLPAAIAVCPVQLPGRETRASEPPFDRMEPLIDALAAAIEAFAHEPFAFFGHSMGAAIAFELARALRARNKPLPAALHVSGARAPQFRREHVPLPPPSDAELLGQLRRLEGLPPDAPRDADVLAAILPPLRADTALYRTYVYSEQPPLPCPIRAYGGLRDPNVTPGHLEAWAAQTTASFTLRMFDGGHFFIRTAREEFLGALGRDLTELASARQGR